MASLSDLPDEIIETILKAGDHLETGAQYLDIANLSRTCVKLNDIVRTGNLVYDTLENSAILAARRMKHKVPK